jgi:putative DNA primase/helicase
MLSEFDEEELAALAPDERLFSLARMKGTVRNRLLKPEHIKTSFRLMIKEPDRFATLKGMLTGWHSLSEFLRLVKAADRMVKENRVAQKVADETAARLAEAEERGFPLIAEGRPVQIARDFVAQVIPDLVEAGGEFLEYHGNAYRTLKKDTVRARVQAWMASGVNADTGEPCNPNKTDVDHVMDALTSHCHRSEYEARPPAWLDEWEGIDPDPRMCIAAANGVLDVTTGELGPLTPRFFTRNGLSFDYDPDAGEPREWLAFLDSIWPLDEGGKGEHDLLQEVMGHLLTGETKYQKIFMLLGPPRAGKGTITRTITQLLGEANVAEHSARDLAKDFGLSMLLGKQALIIPDLRLSRGADYSTIAEILLNISGEDRVGVNRKFKDYDVTKLNTRVVIAANLELVLPDVSGALLTRYIPLVFKKSFIGREDRDLDAKIGRELPAILKWALDGLRRLEARRDSGGRLLGFGDTVEGTHMLREIGRRGSSVVSFIRECCILVPSGRERKGKVFGLFERWCKEHDLESRYVPETFAKAMRSASGYVVDSARLLDDGKRRRFFTGLTLRDDLDFRPGTDIEDDEDDDDY